MNETKFRIGGVYRQKDGAVVELSICSFVHNEPGTAWATDPGYYRCGNGFRRLSDGVDTVGWRDNCRDLLPGELHQVNGEWLPLGVAEEAPKPTPSLGALLRQAWERGSVKPATTKAAAEKVRPALTWNKPASVDRFPGFTSTYDTGPQLEDDNSHPLQRMTDPSDPLHGSAWLRKG